MKKLMLFVTFILPISLFAQVKYIPLNPSVKHKKNDKDDIQVFLSKDKVPFKYEEIGMVVCEKNNDKKAFKKARKEAAKKGAQALYLYSEKDRTTGEKISNALLLTNAKDKFRFIAIIKSD